MCIVFIYRGGNPDIEYRLIVAYNRDESYDRPASFASVWNDDHTIIGGQDMEKGREGGSWLAMSPQRGRIGFLLNLTGHHKPDGKGRGHIVASFLKGSESTPEYIKSLEPNRESYSNYSLVSVEIEKDNVDVYNYSNYNNVLTKASKSFVGYSNTLVATPLKKVTVGTERFQSLCEEFPYKDTQDKLVENLIEFLKWEERHIPDEELIKKQAVNYEWFSSIFVRVPEMRYGTRTHTIILVDNTGHLDFIELSMEQPVDMERPDWHRTHLQDNIGTCI